MLYRFLEQSATSKGNKLGFRGTPEQVSCMYHDARPCLLVHPYELCMQRRVFENHAWPFIRHLSDSLTPTPFRLPTGTQLLTAW